MRGYCYRRKLFTFLFTGYSLIMGGLFVDAQVATPEAPEGFTSFSFKGNEDAARVMNDYLWYHFHHRLGNPDVLFNKEYCLTSDMWLNNATPRGEERTIQEVHRANLLGIEMDNEGAVFTHQHFSHAHDHGWPFPLWTQADYGPDRLLGKAAGWHFQHKEDLHGWGGDHVRAWGREKYFGETAANSWEVENARSEGIVDKRWRVVATAASPTVYSPEGMTIEAQHAPFLQLRWTRTGIPVDHRVPYLEWLREGDDAYGEDRRVYLYPEQTPLSPEDLYHSILTMHTHPKWEGVIKRMRINLAPGESEVTLDIDSFFTVYDTRHTINNPIYIMASDYYFNWTGDLAFLREQINKMRVALKHQQTVMGGLELNHIRNIWPGHEGLPGWVKDEEGNLTVYGGRGIGNNYWDLMPFGWDDFYATYQYYRATLVMADLEEAIRKNPGWNIPEGALAMDPEFLRKHAADVKKTANDLFWNEETGRFYASIDVEGTKYDYGYTFLNLDAIWYGIANKENAVSIMEWLDGERIVEGDTSTGEDIYHWKFGPRATTKRNIEWYGQGWIFPEHIEWGGQIQDGGAVLGFAFYDLWARLQVLGADNAWERLQAIVEWEKEVHAAGGYRAYYADGKQGTTLQGGGTAGGIGVDAEFFESSLIPSIVVYGFVGLNPKPEALYINPALPSQSPEMQIHDLRYRSVVMDITASNNSVVLELKNDPVYELHLEFPVGWVQSDDKPASGIVLTRKGTYTFTR